MGVGILVRANCTGEQIGAGLSLASFRAHFGQWAGFNVKCLPHKAGPNFVGTEPARFPDSNLDSLHRLKDRDVVFGPNKR
jgi:hypothetical protein